MRWVIGIVVFVNFLFASCTEQQESHRIIQQTSDKVFETEGYTPPPDSIKEPIVVKAGIPKIIRAGVPKLTYINAHEGDAGGVSVMQNYTTDNGLALDYITCAMVDKTGNLWFGTEGGGVSRYNGKSFTNFTASNGLTNNIVRSIMEDRHGNIWLGTQGGGALCYNGKSFNGFSIFQNVTNNVVWCITEDKAGNIWFATGGGGVFCYNGESFTNLTTANGLANNDIGSILEDRNGSLWFGTIHGGLSRYNGHPKDGSAARFTNFTSVDGVASNKICCITEDKRGNTWFGTYGDGVSCYNGKSFVNFTTEQGLANNFVLTITEDKKGDIWFGTYGGGVSRFNGQARIGWNDLKATSQGCFTNFTTKQGLVNNNVFTITEDKLGNLWFGTQGDGLSRYDGKSFTHFTSSQGLANNSVSSIVEDRAGNLWFSTEGGGVSRYDGKSFANFTNAQGLAYNYVNCVMEDRKGNLWFGTQGFGISCYDGQVPAVVNNSKGISAAHFVNFTKKQGLAGNSVWSIAEDKKGNLWFGTYGGGISKYDGKNFTNFTTSQGLGDNTVFSILEDKRENVWFATNGGGASKYDGKNFINFKTEQGLADNFVNCITEDKSGNLWFGTTAGGVSRYDGKSFINFNSEQGLNDNCVMQIVIDSSQNIFLGTNLGLTVLTSFTKNQIKSNNEFETLNTAETSISAINTLSNNELKGYSPVFKIYDSSRGYPIKNVHGGQNAMYKDSKGIIWFGSSSEKTALVRFDYGAVHCNLNPPTAILQGIKVDKENICWYDLNQDKYDSLTIAHQEAISFGKSLYEDQRNNFRHKFGDIKFDSIAKFYPLPENLILSYNHNSVAFSFVAVEPSRNFLVQYQYILEGYDKDWSPLTEKTEASFGNIYEGAYTFRVKARNPDGVWSQPTEYKFIVLPPLWRTWWMYTLYVVLFIGLVVSIVQVNGLRLRKRARELTIKIRNATQEVKKQQEVIKEQQIRELELIAIRAQMNPHFLFNVLASIQMLINKSDVVSANNALAKFGKLMRLILENSEKQTIFLEDEIEMLKLYVELESLLLSFNCKIIVDPLLDVQNIPIPTMIIQPYVENAIKHGISGLESGREVVINFKKRQNYLFCTIKDNGIGRQMAEASKGMYSQHKSMGTRLAGDRLKIINKQVASNVEVEVKDLVDNQGLPAGTLVELSLPFSFHEN